MTTITTQDGHTWGYSRCGLAGGRRLAVAGCRFARQAAVTGLHATKPTVNSG